MMKTIDDGVHVVLKKGTKMKVLTICGEKKITFDKKTFSLAAAIGQPFGSSWEVKGRDILPVQETEIESLENAKSADDNRAIKEDTDSQKLRHDDIVSLKKQGVSGEGIIERLVDNSKSFEKKTTFSQEKYLKKKKDKYLTRFTICEPSMRLVTELYWRKTPSPKIIHLRPDTLAQMLACTNVHSGSKVMLVENCQGLLVAAVLERLAGKGSLVHLHTEDLPCTVAEECFDFPALYEGIVMRMQLSYFNKVMGGGEASQDQPMEVTTNGGAVVPDSQESTAGSSPEAQSVTPAEIKAGTSVTTTEEPPSDVTGVTTESTNVSQTPVAKEEVTIATPNEPNTGSTEEQVVTITQKEATMMETEDGPSTDPKEGPSATQTRKRKYPVNQLREQRRVKREELNQRIAQLLEPREMDALLVATRFHPAPIVTRLLEYLAPSRPFVVYCAVKEPLVECFTQLKEAGGVLDMQLTETWLREYQVLENRTHPLVNMSGTGGFILSGTKVAVE